MAEISQHELEERVAILKRFRSLLEQQKKKFQEYLNILEKQQDSIDSEDTKALAIHTELGQEVASGIANLQKVIVPMSEIYKAVSSKNSTEENESVEKIQADLSRLQNEVLEQNQKNKELLKTHLVQIRNQIQNFTNPYRNIKSVYAQKVPVGNLVEVNI